MSSCIKSSISLGSKYSTCYQVLQRSHLTDKLRATSKASTYLEFGLSAMNMPKLVITAVWALLSAAEYNIASAKVAKMSCVWNISTHNPKLCWTAGSNQALYLVKNVPKQIALLLHVAES